MKLKDLFDVAFKIESSGYSYYQNMAEKVGGDKKDLFLDLSEQERDHRKTFESILEKHQSGDTQTNQTWEEQEVRGYMKSFAELSVFPSLETEEVPDDYKEALKLAVDVEKNSVIFYQDIEYLIKNKEPIQDIIDEEKNHMMTLLEELRSLE